MLKVVKRNGEIVDWENGKVERAVGHAVKRAPTTKVGLGKVVENEVKFLISELGVNQIEVDVIHRYVENTLMDFKEYDVAREYITYRKEHMPDIFRPRVEYRPYEYPHLASYSTTINHSYWLFSHYNYSPDIQDIKINMSPQKAETALRCILAISQIEVAVKRFWSKVGDMFPKPEIEEVGATFAESEVRHAQAYSNLLDIMGLNGRFKELQSIPAIANRIKFLSSAISKADTKEDYVKNIILFSILIENVSLFSQFYILLKMNKDDKYLKGTANAILATSKEEVIHANFGFDLINTIKKERPEWWTEELKRSIVEQTEEALQVEADVLYWICNEDDALEAEVWGFLRLRVAESLAAVGIDSPYLHRIDKKPYEWFYTLTESRMAVDFFDSKDPAYTKANSFTEDDLF